MKNLMIVLFALLLALPLTAQQKTHEAQPKETVYGISKQYGITQEALINANPFLKERGLQIGDVLTIPGGDGSIKPVITPPEPVYAEDVPEPVDTSDFLYFEVPPQQTIFSITQEYNISEETLRSLNPQLEQGLKAGDIIRVPKKKPDAPQEEIVPEGMYKVQRGDTVYTLSKQFGITTDAFYIANPIVQTRGLSEGSFVNIPKPEKGKKAVIKDGFIEHKVSRGETIFSITRRYQVSFDDLLTHNPELINGLVAGMILKIPLTEDNQIHLFRGKIVRVTDDKINIAYLLPFFLDDSKGHSREKAVAEDFLIGSKLALDSLALTGKQVNVRIFDSKNDAPSLEALLAQNDFSQFDAIIGPLFGSTFRSLGLMLEGSGIALVSPLSNSKDLYELENTLIATPSDKPLADAIVAEVKENYKGEQIQVLTDSKNRELAEYFVEELRKKISGADVFITEEATGLVQPSETVPETLSDGTEVDKVYFTPITTVLVSESNQLGNAYLDRIRQMDAQNLQGYGVKFVSAYDMYNSKNSENTNALKEIGFTFSARRLVDVHGDAERETLNKFLNTYCDTPNEYQQVGFDVTYDIVSRMNSSGDLLHALGAEQTRLATKFNYKKEGEAYVNQGVRVVRIFVRADESPDDDVQEVKD